MKREEILKAESEAIRFLRTVGDLKERLDDDRYALYGCRESASVKRASMDLTNALADMRNK